MRAGRRGRAVARLDDAALARRAGGGQPDAFAELYDRHARVAHGYARRLCGPELADDVVQEAFLALWRGVAEYDPARASVRTLLLTLVHHRAMDALRRAAVRSRHTGATVPEEAPADGATDADALRSAEAADVRGAVRLLPREQAEVVALAYYAGLTQREIAAALGLPLGTVKGRMRRALERLGQALPAPCPT